MYNKCGQKYSNAIGLLKVSYQYPSYKPKGKSFVELRFWMISKLFWFNFVYFSVVFRFQNALSDWFATPQLSSGSKQSWVRCIISFDKARYQNHIPFEFSDPPMA